uniref:Carboxypeptidase regulatory-like domain-containing protein n=1 Tax=Acidobacterium capsulatum TaxID=33075 RepID=A0A7V4XUI1_9BACT
MIRRLFIPGTAMLLLAISASAQTHPATPEAYVSGVVRNSQGAPESGALVELMRPDQKIVAEMATDTHGHYALHHIPPGNYELRATNPLFLPTIRENLELAASTRVVVNLTLNTLYEAFRWLPAEPRKAGEPPDDWTWTLRLSADRPLLRMLQNGPLVVVTDSNGNRTLKARVTLRGGDSRFGDGGVHQDFELARSLDGSRGLVLRADLADPVETGSPAVRMVAGYEHRLAFGNSFRSVGIVEDHPGISGGAVQGLSSFALRNAETLNLMPGVEAQVGDQVLGFHSTSTTVGNYPFALLTVQSGHTRYSYSVATSPDAQSADMVDEETNLSAAATELNGQLVTEHGLHQQFTISHGTDGSGRAMSVSVYHDQVENPIVNGGGSPSNVDLNSGNLLFDPVAGQLSAAGQSYSATGIVAEIRNPMGANLRLTVDAATGEALAAASQMAEPVSFSAPLDQAQPEAANMVAISASGRVDRTGTAWRAAYRWQTAGTLTPVAPFSTALPDAYLSLYLRQPIHCRMLPNGMEALVDVRNLLAEGYRPFLSSDGSQLYFAQLSRSIEGGLSFSF